MNMEVKYKTQMDLNLNGNVVESSTKTFEMSKKYIKLLVQVTIFNIICRRMTINENELEKREYEKVPYFIVKRKKQIDEKAIKLYLKLIPGFNDAIDQNYLKAVYLFFKNENDEVVENYSLNLKYNTGELDSDNANIHTPKSVKEASIVLLKAVASLPNQKLKGDICAVIEITYNDDTPPDYEPRAFRPCLLPLCFNTPSPYLLMGKIFTGFHKLTARCSRTITSPESSCDKERSLLLEMENEQDENINEGKRRRLSIIIEESEIINLDSPLNDQNPTAGDDKSSDIFIEPESPETKGCITYCNTISSREVESSSISTIPDFKCVCELREDFGIDLIGCIACNRKYHAICYGFFKKDKPSNFVCLNCDIGAHNNYINIQKTAILRLICFFIKSKNEIPKQMLSQLTDDMFLKLKEINLITEDSKNWEECKFDKNYLPNAEQFIFPNQYDSNYFF